MILPPLIKQQCSANRNVAFLKVHKAGSTTVQNILQRMTLTYDLNAVLPNTNDTRYTNGLYHVLYLFHNGLLAKHNNNYVNIIPPPQGGVYNMLFNHAFYNRTEWAELLPDDVIYLAIVRETESRFVSAVRYWREPDASGSEVASFLHERFHQVWNQPMFDNPHARLFGLSQNVIFQKDKMFEMARNLTQQFDLLMVLEYFPESMILLKRRLCWKLKDVIYIPTNIGESEVKVRLNPKDKAKLFAWQRADVILYQVFVSKFERLMRQEGGGFAAEVDHFKQVLKLVERHCNGPADKEDLQVNSSRWSEQFSVTGQDCRWMKTSEWDLHDILVDRAWTKFTASRTHKPTL